MRRTNRVSALGRRLLLGLAAIPASVSVLSGQVAERPELRIVRPPMACDKVALGSVSVVRNNDPVPNYSSAPTYSGVPALSGTTWTAAVPAEAYDLQTPYLVRMTFQNTGTSQAGFGFWLEAYHPALAVLTAQQASGLKYVEGPNAGGPCFIKVTTPAARQVGSMQSRDTRQRIVTDDWPADVGLNGQYGLQLWYFNSAGVFTKKGDYVIKLTSCTASPADRFHCQ